jgi:hypothetical protein
LATTQIHKKWSRMGKKQYQTVRTLPKSYNIAMTNFASLYIFWWNDNTQPYNCLLIVIYYLDYIMCWIQDSLQQRYSPNCVWAAIGCIVSQWGEVWTKSNSCYQLSSSVRKWQNTLWQAVDIIRRTFWKTSKDRQHTVKRQKDKQWSTKHTYKTKDWVTRSPLKTGGGLRCSSFLSKCSSYDINSLYEAKFVIAMLYSTHATSNNETMAKI